MNTARPEGAGRLRHVTGWEDRVDGADWAAVTAEVNELGCALLPRLLTQQECRAITGL
jgi:uncharacterized protein